MSYRLPLAVAALALLGCSDVATRPESGKVVTDTTQGPGTTPVPDPGVAQRRLIECPATQASAAAGLIGVLGGTIVAAGSSISIPAGSLPPLTSVLIELT